MKTLAIAAVVAAASFPVFAQAGTAPSGSSIPDSPDATVSQPSPRMLDAVKPADGGVIARIDQNNTPPDRGCETGKSRTGRF